MGDTKNESKQELLAAQCTNWNDNEIIDLLYDIFVTREMYYYFTVVSWCTITTQLLFGR